MKNLFILIIHIKSSELTVLLFPHSQLNYPPSSRRRIKYIILASDIPIISNNYIFMFHMYSSRQLPNNMQVDDVLIYFCTRGILFTEIKVEIALTYRCH